jgi:hypothetical protein
MWTSQVHPLSLHTNSHIQASCSCCDSRASGYQCLTTCSLMRPQRLQICSACTPLHCVVAVTLLMSAVQIHAEFYTPMDFAKFPWDKQDLLIEIRYVHNRGDSQQQIWHCTRCQTATMSPHRHCLASTPCQVASSG